MPHGKVCLSGTRVPVSSPTAVTATWILSLPVYPPGASFECPTGSPAASQGLPTFPTLTGHRVGGTSQPGGPGSVCIPLFPCQEIVQVMEIPACSPIHSTESATAENIVGAERYPNGNTESIMSTDMPSRSLSWGWMGIFLYSCSTSIFARRVFWPSCTIFPTELSTIALCIEHHCSVMPSFRLK